MSSSPQNLFCLSFPIPRGNSFADTSKLKMLKSNANISQAPMFCKRLNQCVLPCAILEIIFAQWYISPVSAVCVTTSCTFPSHNTSTFLLLLSCPQRQWISFSLFLRLNNASLIFSNSELCRTMVDAICNYIQITQRKWQWIINYRNSDGEAEGGVQVRKKGGAESSVL